MGWVDSDKTSQTSIGCTTYNFTALIVVDRISLEPNSLSESPQLNFLYHENKMLKQGNLFLEKQK